MSGLYPTTSEKRAFNLNRAVEMQRTDLTSGVDVLQLMKNGRIVSLTTHATPGTEVAVAHGLLDDSGNAKTPNGFIVISQDKSGSVYDGSTANTSTNFYVRSDAASLTASVIVF